jgi:FkbM family methyltransferase
MDAPNSFNYRFGRMEEQIDPGFGWRQTLRRYLRNGQYEIDQYRRLLSAAQNWRERRSVLLYAAHEAWGRLRGGKALLAEVGLDLQGARHFPALRRSEVFVLEELYIDRIYERLPDFIPGPGWTVVDLGANVGMFTVQQALRGAHVFAFEPNPDCYRRLRRAVEANHAGHLVATYPVALGAASGTATLMVGKSSGAGSLFFHQDNRDPDARRYVVPLMTLDEAVLTLGISHIDLLKIDVEKAELDVLEGSRRILPLIDRIVMEYHSRELAVAARELLIGAGFELRLREPTYGGGELGNVFYSRA